jgi:hypothetical protein
VSGGGEVSGESGIESGSRSGGLPSILEKAESYRKYASIKCHAHYSLAQDAGKRQLQLGIPVTILTTIVGTSIFATINSTDQVIWLRIGTGLLSITAAVLAALQTLFNYSAIATNHQRAAVEFAEIWHKFDRFILRYQISETNDIAPALDDLEKISKKMDAVDRRSPTVPDRVYDALKARPGRLTTPPPLTR